MSSPPQIGRRGRADYPAPAACEPTDDQQDHGDRSVRATVPVVTGTELAPIGKAQYPRVSVHHVACGHVHSHIKFEANATAIVRSPACAPHTEYRIAITAVIPSRTSRAEVAA